MTYNVFGGPLNLTQLQLHCTAVTCTGETCERSCNYVHAAERVDSIQIGNQRCVLTRRHYVYSSDCSQQRCC